MFMNCQSLTNLEYQMQMVCLHCTYQSTGNIVTFEISMVFLTYLPVILSPVQVYHLTFVDGVEHNTPSILQFKYIVW